MKTHSRQITETLYGEVCVCSPLGELLPAYVAGLLEDSAAEEVEDHLLVCLHCRTKYLNILSIGDALRRAETGQSPAALNASPDDRPSGGAKVLRMAAFRKRRA